MVQSWVGLKTGKEETVEVRVPGWLWGTAPGSPVQEVLPLGVETWDPRLGAECPHRDASRPFSTVAAFSAEADFGDRCCSPGVTPSGPPVHFVYTPPTSPVGRDWLGDSAGCPAGCRLSARPSLLWSRSAVSPDGPELIPGAAGTSSCRSEFARRTDRASRVCGDRSCRNTPPRPNTEP